MPHWSDPLENLGICAEPYTWMKQQIDDTTAWTACTRGDWLLWLLARIPTTGAKNLVRCAMDCAIVVVSDLGDKDQPTIDDLDNAIEDWLVDAITQDQLEDLAQQVHVTYPDSLPMQSVAHAAYYIPRDVSRATLVTHATCAIFCDQNPTKLSNCADIVRSYFPDPPEI